MTEPLVVTMTPVAQVKLAQSIIHDLRRHWAEAEDRVSLKLATASNCSFIAFLRSRSKNYFQGGF